MVMTLFNGLSWLSEHIVFLESISQNACVRSLGGCRINTATLAVEKRAIHHTARLSVKT